MATGGVTTLQALCEDIKCRNCRNDPRTPKTLPCLHTYCEDCLATHMAGLPDGDKRRLPCPECRTAQNPLLEEADVGRLKTNYCFENLLHYARKNGETASGGRTMRCGRCSRVTRPVDAFCTVCKLVLCDLCVEDHRATRDTSGHELIRLEQMRDRPVSQHRRWLCTKHSDFERTLSQAAIYCEECREVICFVCTTTNPHSNHPTHTATVAYNDQGRKGEIQRSSEGAAAVEEEFTRAMDELEEIKTQLGVSRDTANQEIEAKAEALQEELEREKEAVQQRVEEIYAEKTAQCDQQIQELREIRDKFVHSRKITEEVLIVGAPEDALFLQDQLTSRLDGLCLTYRGHNRKPCEDDVIQFTENTRVTLRGALGHVSPELFIPGLRGSQVDDNFYANTL